MGRRADGHQHPTNRQRSFRVSRPLLRALRASRGWTQEQAAKNARLSDRLIRKAEAGGKIDLRTIAMLAEVYSTPTAILTPRDLLADPLPATGKSAVPPCAEALVRRWFKSIWDEGRLEAIKDLTAPDCVLHAEGVTLHGRAELRRRTEEIRAAFSDIDLVIEDLAVHGAIVICRWRVAMTHTGTWHKNPPTGKRLRVHGSSWMRVENGLLQEGWDYWEEKQATDATSAADDK